MSLRSGLALAALILTSITAFAASTELHTVRFASCRTGVCTRLLTEHVSLSPLQPHMYVFGAAQMELVDESDSKKTIQKFEGGDGYFDMKEQVIVLRHLVHSPHRELIYDLVEGKFIYF